MAIRPFDRALKFVFWAALTALGLGAVEFGLRYLNRPSAIVSGWLATVTQGPFNQIGLRGRPWPPRSPGDVVVTLVGAEEVECVRCPPDETLDLILENALRTFNPAARAVALGATGYGLDQEYLALRDYFDHERASILLVWISPARDVARVTFRTGHPAPGRTAPKPAFWLRDGELLGPTEGVGHDIHWSKLATWLVPLFADADARWNRSLPAADPGSRVAPAGLAVQRIDNAPEDPNSPWGIWLQPPPPRARYGLDVTRALLRRMAETATLRGTRFILVMPQPAAVDRAVALAHAGHWFVADPARRDAAIAELTAGFETIILEPDDSANAGNGAAPDSERRTMAQLATILHQRNYLDPATVPRSRR